MRRIDSSFQRMDEIVDALPDADKTALTLTKEWAAISVLSRLRGVELAEEDVTGHSASDSVADAYDRAIHPGEPLVHALVKTFSAVFGV